VLILDGFGLLLGLRERKAPLEVLKDHRNRVGATALTSQFELKDWHAAIGDAALTDAGLQVTIPIVVIPIVVAAHSLEQC
jgi:hypothetical protein